MAIAHAGVSIHDKKRATPGYTVFSTVRGDRAFVVDMEGNPVNEWKLEAPALNYANLLENGNLLIMQRGEGGPGLTQGKGGLLREFDWDGNLVWEHQDPFQHHDVRRLASGNTHYLAWEELSDEQAARVQGGLPGTELDGKIWGDCLREVTPGGELVWEWHAYDLEIENYPVCASCHRAEFAHGNTCAPMENGDIMLSFRVLNTIMIIERLTGKVKWERHDPAFGHQHDCHMLDNGNILLFCNGYHTPDNSHSKVIELDPESGETKWEYMANPVLGFFSPHISGAQRLDSGNTLICEGSKGHLFEVTPEGETVWDYICPYFHVDERWGELNWIFRAYRYAADSPQIRNRV